jgi:hypothetical protein
LCKLLTKIVFVNYLQILVSVTFNPTHNWNLFIYACEKCILDFNFFKRTLLCFYPFLRYTWKHVVIVCLWVKLAAGSRVIQRCWTSSDVCRLKSGCDLDSTWEWAIWAIFSAVLILFL